MGVQQSCYMHDLYLPPRLLEKTFCWFVIISSTQRQWWHLLAFDFDLLPSMFDKFHFFVAAIDWIVSIRKTLEEYSSQLQVVADL